MTPTPDPKAIELMPKWMCDLIDGFPWDNSDYSLKRSYACQEAGLLDMLETEKGSNDEEEYGEYVFRLTALGDKAQLQANSTRASHPREDVEEMLDIVKAIAHTETGDTVTISAIKEAAKHCIKIKAGGE